MNQDATSSVPTPAFVERFEQAGKHYAQYCQEDTGTTRQELALKALTEAGFIELEPRQQMLVIKVMAYHAATREFDRLSIINWAWHNYSNT